MMPEFKPGDRVLYMAHSDHHTDRDVQGRLLFHFHHAEDHPGLGVRRGDRADPHAAATRVQAKQAHSPPLLQRVAGVLHTAEGHPVVPGKPLTAWEAKIVRINADGTADLEIKHPFGGITLHYPDRLRCVEEVIGETENADGTVSRHVKRVYPNLQAPGIPYDPVGKGHHTFHLPEE